MLSKLIRTFYGDVSKEEIKKFLTLSATFFFVIGVYWLLRPLKDGIFFNTVGGAYQPWAKTASIFVVVTMVLIYSKLIDIFEKHKLFYVVGSFFAILYLSIAFFIGHPTIGLANPELGPHRWIGWLTYFSIEGFGSIVIALFWSFCASITGTESAKKGFPLVIAGGQLGGLLGPFLATQAKSLGMQMLAGIAGLGVIGMMCMIYYFMKTTPDSMLHSGKKAEKSEKKPKTGFFEGLKLIFTRPYVFGIFAIISLFEIVSTIVDYQMKMQANSLHSGAEAFTTFLGYFGMLTNGLALAMALLGTSYMLRKFGLLFCLLAFPVILGVAIMGLYGTSIIPGISPNTILWLTVGVMVLAKGLSYALNNPSKETMYIPTSKDVKFKAKSWSEAFGSRTAKATGSQINLVLRQNLSSMMIYGTLISLGLIGIWIMVALFVGRKFNKLSKTGEIVE